MQERAIKALRRTNGRIQDIMLGAYLRSNGMLSGYEAMEIMNIYGLDIYSITILAASYGWKVDYEEFDKLYEEEDRIHKNMRLCSG